MVAIYPVQAKRKGYNGADAKKRAKAQRLNEIAGRLERCINQMIEADPAPVQTYLYFQIADKTGHDLKTVTDLCFPIDGGSNGFTVAKSPEAFGQWQRDSLT